MQDSKPAMEYCHHPNLSYARFTKDKGEKQRGTVILLDDTGEKECFAGTCMLINSHESLTRFIYKRR